MSLSLVEKDEVLEGHRRKNIIYNTGEEVVINNNKMRQIEWILEWSEIKYGALLISSYRHIFSEGMELEIIDRYNDKGIHGAYVRSTDDYCSLQICWLRSFMEENIQNRIPGSENIRLTDLTHDMFNKYLFGDKIRLYIEENNIKKIIAEYIIKNIKGMKIMDAIKLSRNEPTISRCKISYKFKKIRSIAYKGKKHFVKHDDDAIRRASLLFAKDYRETFNTVVELEGPGGGKYYSTYSGDVHNPIPISDSDIDTGIYAASGLTNQRTAEMLFAIADKFGCYNNGQFEINIDGISDRNDVVDSTEILKIDEKSSETGGGDMEHKNNIDIYAFVGRVAEKCEKWKKLDDESKTMANERDKKIEKEKELERDLEGIRTDISGLNIKIEKNNKEKEDVEIYFKSLVDVEKKVEEKKIEIIEKSKDVNE